MLRFASGELDPAGARTAASSSTSSAKEPSCDSLPELHPSCGLDDVSLSRIEDQMMFSGESEPPTEPRSESKLDLARALADAKGEIEALRAENARLHEKLTRRTVEVLPIERLVLRTIVSTVPSAVWWKDRDSVMLGCNQHFASLAGMANAEAIVGCSDRDLPWTAAEAEKYRQDDLAVMESGEPRVDIEETLLDAQGQMHTVLTAKVPLRDDDGRIIGTLGTCTDITARKAMERELNAAMESAERASRAKSDFLATVTHELRTPLALVLAPLESLRDRAGLPPDAVADIDRVRRNAMRLQQQVDDILDFAKVDAGKVAPVLEAVDLRALIDALVDDVSPTAATRGLTLAFDRPESARTGPLVAVVDRGLFEHILLNLLGNALKFTPSGGSVIVSLEVFGTHLELAVRDTGIGISAANQQLLFQRFQQLDTSSTRRYEGSGLGLAIVKELAALLGGTVGVDSEAGKGSCFWVRMPWRRAAAGTKVWSTPDVRDDAVRKRRRSGLHARFPDARSMPPRAELPLMPTGTRPRVVLAEDNADLRTYIASLLERDYDVVACKNGLEALDEITKTPPDVIVSDVRMPELDGHQLIERLKKNDALLHIPILLLTADATERDLATSLGLGADDFVRKPFSPRELLARIGAAARIGSVHRSLVERNRELVATRDMLVRSEKLAAAGRLLAQLSHEINNPMCVIVGNLPLLTQHLSVLQTDLRARKMVERDLDPGAAAQFEDLRKTFEIDYVLDDLADGLRAMGEAVERVCGIQRDVRSYLRGETSEMAEGDLEDALRLTLDVLKRGLPPDIEIRTTYGGLPTLRFNRGQMKQVFLNLLKNAVDAVGRKGVVDVVTRMNGDVATVTVSDTGSGIATEHRAHIFEPFFSTKDLAGGSGIGLAVCRQIMANHGGAVRLDDTYDHGAKFVVELPTERP